MFPSWPRPPKRRSASPTRIRRREDGKDSLFRSRISPVSVASAPEMIKAGPPRQRPGSEHEQHDRERETNPRSSATMTRFAPLMSPLP